ncbi:MAG TPA: hypothetical protein DD502_15590, partial [Cupriavidus sp.]|nr:hypothetical protein [Cupriavidus sp.]
MLQLCQTFDATLDEGWKGGYFGQLSASPTGITLWWYRSRWLQRNPGYSLDFSILGMPFIQTQWTVVRCDGVNFYAKG